MQRRLRIALYGLIGFVLTVGMMAVYQGYKNSATAQDWRTASREPVGLAPDPERTPEAVVQVYAERAWSWRGGCARLRTRRPSWRRPRSRTSRCVF